MHYKCVLLLGINSHCEKCSLAFLLQAMYIECFGKSIENKSTEDDERAENFPKSPETPLFLKSLDTVKTPESVEKMQFPNSTFFEM